MAIGGSFGEERWEGCRGWLLREKEGEHCRERLAGEGERVMVHPPALVTQQSPFFDLGTVG